jgi:phospholipase/carboxylesterase
MVLVDTAKRMFKRLSNIFQGSACQKADLKHQFNYLSFGKTEGAPSQIIFLLHGYGRSAFFMTKVADEITARMPDALVMALEAPEELDLPQNIDNQDYVLRIPEILMNDTVDQSLRRQWFSIQSGGIGEYQDMTRRVAADLNAFISDKRDEYSLSDKQIGLMGFSQGAAVGLCASLTRESKLGCVVVHSGPFFGDYSDFRSKPSMLYLYGDNDEEFSASHFKLMRDQLKGYHSAIDTQVIKGLQHRTSSVSRKALAKYFEHKMM